MDYSPEITLISNLVTLVTLGIPYVLIVGILWRIFKKLK